MATVRRASRIAVSALSIVAGLGAVATPVNANEAPEKREASKKRPVYVIAHGANDRASVDRAVEAGVNGVEIDICANKDYKGKGKGKGDAGAPSWYVDHDCKGPQGKPSLDDMFRKLAELEASKRPVVVWLDIKTPDECANSDDQCSTRVVAEKAKTLTKANINVLYDLTSENYAKNRSTLGAAGFKNLKPEMTAVSGGVPMEGVGFWGDAKTGISEFEKAKVESNRRVLEPACDQSTTSELTEATDKRTKGSLAAVFGWTLYSKNSSCPGMLDALKQGNIDGIIVGNHNFGTKPGDRGVAEMVVKSANGDKTRLATQGDRLFRK